MHNLYYQPEGAWFGDCMPFHDGKAFYLFHQRDTRDPGPFGQPFGWALARTNDFVDFEDLGEALERGEDSDQDQFIFAGSVFEADGTYYAMYTGYNRDYPAQGRASQVLMIATSSDLKTWNKTSRKLVVPQEGYDENDWRDPFVLWDEEAGRYLMILGARTLEGEKILTGRTVYFTSNDLREWTFEGDFWAPGLYSMHEMPDLFRMGDYWYLLTTEYSDRSKTVYRMSTSLDGPWTAPADDAFDGRAYYAARSATDGEHRYLFGWVPTKEGEDDLAPWEWGGTLVVHEVVQRADGSLGAAVPKGVADAFAPSEVVGDGSVLLGPADGLSEVRLIEDTGDLFRFTARVRFSGGTRSFALRLFEDDASGDAYEFRFDVGEGRLVFDRRPNLHGPHYANKGLDRPLALRSGTDYTLELIVDDTIATVYIDGVALNSRMYSKAGTSLAVQVVDGELAIDDASVQRGLRAR